MTPLVQEIQAKSILTKSRVFPYVINPYRGCQHGCTYCYARFMKRVTGHKEPWGEFVDVKVNAAELLRAEVRRKKPGRVWISGVCDPYQPLEAKYKLTRQCLQILVENKWPLTVQTRSPLVVRDMDILIGAPEVEVGFTITTADDSVRKLFEPHAPPIHARIEALDKLHRAGIRTFAMIAPMLPGAEGLGELLKGKVDHVLIDRMNYHYADWVYRKHGLQHELTPDFFETTARELARAWQESGIECEVIC